MKAKPIRATRMNRILKPHEAEAPAAPTFVKPSQKHAHYYRHVAGLESIDVYRVLHLFGVTDPALAHAAKKVLVAGGRGAGKDISQDVQEAIDTLERWQHMQAENEHMANIAA